ncbi:hypothetical protein HHI36_010069 [Cryptolaemus montrouzieri]|uniref:Tetraspanin n=1 Tax=Cryptolaemus montrouzieri TaxID=559131 RepID=A0ABD2MHS4_9CUCU
MALGRSMDGCGNFIKYSLFIVNSIICIGGLIAFGFGIWIVIDKSFANELLGTNLYGGASWIMIITGLAVALLSSLGCIGSIKEIRCLLFMYMLCLTFIFVTMLVGGIIGYVFREKAELTIRNGMTSSLREYGNYRPVTAAWDATQQRLRCCGIDSYRDWKGHVPDSCCKPSHHGRLQKCNQVEQLNDHVSYMKGCLNVTKEYVQENALIIGTLCIIVAFMMILGIIFSFALFRLIE